MKYNFIAKACFYCVLPSVVWFLYKLVIDMKYINYIVDKKIIFDNRNANMKTFNIFKNETQRSLKYILQWTSPKTVPFVYMGKGQEGFIARKCKYTNCFVTAHRSMLKDLTKFDAVIFAGPQARFLHVKGYRDLPNRRAMHQKYVYASIESSDNYPVCSRHFDGFYNWTWTYKLDSDSMWGYMAIRDSENNVVGPKKVMHWMNLDDMKRVSDNVKEKLKNKKKAVAWFVSNCETRSAREKFVGALVMHLKKFNLTLDIFGKCSHKICDKEKENCEKMIEDDYYFYLSFENSFAEDYVTEKLLHPLKNYVVPIVYGGANYTRFMPDNIYLDARKLGPGNLSKKIDELIKNPHLYSEYFRWKNHYTYHYRHESIETDDYCGFCDLLNNENVVKRTTIYKNFKDWWDPPDRCVL